MRNAPKFCPYLLVERSADTMTYHRWKIIIAQLLFVYWNIPTAIFLRILAKNHSSEYERRRANSLFTQNLLFYPSRRREIREGIIRCILATDMARHNEILTQFQEVSPNFDYTNESHINLVSEHVTCSNSVQIMRIFRFRQW